MAKLKKWVRNVKTVSTYPPKDLFKRDARTIANTMAKKSVSPRGIDSGIRMIQYFINRAGKGLSMTRKRELEKAKRILQKKRERRAKARQARSAGSRRLRAGDS
jgi:tRNA(adenine34) deaminase